MATTQTAAATHGAPLVRLSLLQRIVRNPIGLTTSVFLLIVLAIAILAPVISAFDPAATDTDNLMVGPGGAHLLGTDSAGRDILARLFFGAQTTLISAVVVVITAVIIGVPSGLIAGYYALHRAGHRVAVYEADFRPMKQAFIGGSERTRMKLLVDADSDRVLAVHMAGADAPAADYAPLAEWGASPRS